MGRVRRCFKEEVGFVVFIIKDIILNTNANSAIKLNEPCGFLSRFCSSILETTGVSLKTTKQIVRRSYRTYVLVPICENAFNSTRKVLKVFITVHSAAHAKILSWQTFQFL